MPSIDLTTWGVSSQDSATPTKAPAKTGFMDGLAATWRQESVWQSSGVRPSLEYPDDASFDYKTYDKSLWGVVSAARNNDHAFDLVKQYEREKANREILENQNWAVGLSQDVLVGLTNPLNFLGAGPAATLGKAAVKAGIGAAAGTAATEAILQSSQVTRTAAESAMNIAGAGAIGGVLGAGAKAVGNRWSRGSFTANEAVPTVAPSDLPAAPLTSYGEGQSIGAAAVKQRSMADAKIANLYEGVVRATKGDMVGLGDLTRSAYQRLATSNLTSTRNAANLLFRQELATVENTMGVANQVPVEVAAGQRFGEIGTRLSEANVAASDSWWKKMQNGTYDKTAVLDELRRIDPSLPDTYELNQTSFNKVLKAVMAEGDDSPLSAMSEIKDYVQTAIKEHQSLDVDLIDYGLIKKGDLIDLATGERVGDPAESALAQSLKKFREERAELNRELEAAKKAKAPKPQVDDLKSKLAEHDRMIEAHKDELAAKVEAYNNIIPDSKTHGIAYEDGSTYLSRLFDKGRILQNREGFIDDLVKGWLSRNPDLDLADADLMPSLRESAQKVSEKLLGEDRVSTFGDVFKNLDIPGKYTKGRTLAVDDSYMLNWTHDDVLATQLHHFKRAIADVEIRKVMGKDGLEGIRSEINKEKLIREQEINAKYGANTPEAAKELRALQEEAKKDLDQLEFVVRKIKGEPPTKDVSELKLLELIVGYANRFAGMAQLGMPAIPNSLSDVASVGRNFGHLRTWGKWLRGALPTEARADYAKNAKEAGLWFDLLEGQVHNTQANEALAASLDPNQGFRSPRRQKVDRGIDGLSRGFSFFSGIDYWAKSGRAVAATASNNHIVESALKGWDALTPTVQADLAKFYIDKDMLERIAVQFKKQATSKDLNFATVATWDDAVARDTFKASVYAHAQHALNLPSVGSGSSFMTENLMGRIFMRFQTFNNAAHQTTTLASLQNRDASRVVTGLMAYSFVALGSKFAYDTLTGRPVSMDEYFGDEAKTTKTLFAMMNRSGYLPAIIEPAIAPLKAAGDIKGPVGDTVKSVLPEGVVNELFPKYADATWQEKLLGPTAAWGTSVAGAMGGLLDGEWLEKDIHKLRTVLPGQNAFSIKRALDYLEEYLGGRPADYYQKQ